MATLSLYLFLPLCLTIYLHVNSQVTVAPNLYQNKIKFGYGVNFKYNGQLYHNLDRIWVVTRINVPRFQDIAFPDYDINNECAYLNKEAERFRSNARKALYSNLCALMKPFFSLVSEKEQYYRDKLYQVLENDIGTAFGQMNKDY